MIKFAMGNASGSDTQSVDILVDPSSAGCTETTITILTNSGILGALPMLKFLHVTESSGFMREFTVCNKNL